MESNTLQDRLHISRNSSDPTSTGQGLRDLERDPESPARGHHSVARESQRSTRPQSGHSALMRSISADEFYDLEPQNQRRSPARGPDAQNQNQHGHETDFEVTFDGLKDPFNPKCKSTARRWLICIIICTSSLCV